MGKRMKKSDLVNELQKTSTHVSEEMDEDDDWRQLKHL